MLENAGIPFQQKYLIEGKQGRISARKLAKQLLTLDDPPTAIFASSDTQAIGVLDVAQEIGKKVPDELSVIGYDNIRDSAYNDLTTIDQNLFDSGAKGAQMLLEVLGNLVKVPCKQFVSLELLKRKSTASPSISVHESKI
jgi:DNA-binding LacI/PurR family transcriptional regulator